MFKKLLQEYVPRSHCMYQDQSLIFTHLLGDTFIAIAYLMIGLMIFWLYGRLVNTIHRRMAFLSGSFVLLCGITHIFDIISIWHTYYWLDGVIKLITGIVSLAAMVYVPAVARDIAMYVIHIKKSVDETKAKVEQVKRINDTL